MKRISISYELSDNRRYDEFFKRLRDLGATPAINTQWLLETELTVQEIKRDLRRYLDPADRLLVTYVGVMSSQNLIDFDRLKDAV